MNERISTFTLTAAVMVGAVLCVLLAAPFLGALAWALTLGVLFVPLQVRFERVFRSRGIAAVLTVLVAAIIVATPAVLVIERLVREAAASAVFIQAKLAAKSIRLPAFVYWVQEQIDLPAMISRLTTWLSNVSASFLRGSLAQALEIVLTFYILFFVLRDRGAACALLRGVLPLNRTETDRLFARIVDTINATIYGTIVVAIIQGALGGLMFLVLGLSAPVLWGLIMALLSMVPVLGAFIVWIPEAILLILDGHEIKAAILIVWGGVVVGGIDNVIRPILLGNRLRLHTVPTFISIIGGLVLFGPPGFVLGPLVLTTTLVLLEILRARANLPML